MKGKILRKNADSVEILLYETNPSLANSFRRALLSEVPVMAVDEVIFYMNTTEFPDEYIAHRLAMIPIKTDLSSYRVGDGKIVTLRVDKRAEKDGEVVYSGDLESSDPAIVPANPNIPIVVMQEGAALRLEAIVRMGKGKWHSKWQAVSGLGYSYFPVYRLRGEALEFCREILEKCPGEAVEEEDGCMIVRDYTLCPELKEAIEEARRRGVEGVDVEWDDSRIIIKFETTGALKIEEIIESAISELINRLELLRGKLSPRE
ncbi:MAG: DNA-directed RNA polymerase subunit D [Thermoproteota archaeon]|nr:MAG: DNA-directed RNA polymerase subunit D [Candidatus Korarchaeota archaeon]